MKKIRIYKPHTHKGQRLDPPAEGLEIEVDDTDAAWLEKNTDVLKKPEAKAAPSASPSTNA